MDAMDQLDAATRRYSKTKQEHDDARDIAVKAVVAALREGKERRTVIADRSPFTAAYVRRIAREHGIEGDQRYVREVKGK